MSSKPSNGHKLGCGCPFCTNWRAAREREEEERYADGKKKKGRHHQGNEVPARDDKAPRKTRQQTDTRQKTKKRKAGPGRPKGSIVSQETGLTPNQERVAEKMLEAELESGLFPSSVAQVAKVSNSDPKYVRELLKKEAFQKYVMKLLELEGVVLEGAFWRGMALGLSVGDSKVLELYAKMTGKITNKTETKIEVEIKGTEGAPKLDWVDSEVIDAEVIEPEEEEEG